MNVYSAALALMVLVVPLSLCLGATSAQSQPRAAIVTGEVHNPPSRDIEFRHEPLLASWTVRTLHRLGRPKPLCPAPEHFQRSLGLVGITKTGTTSPYLLNPATVCTRS